MAATVNRLKLFLKNIYLDYYEVFKEAQRGAKARPLRASFYGASTLFALNLFRVNEDLRSYHSEVISACNRITAVTASSRNPVSYKFVQNVGELNGHGLLRQIDLGFSTVIYRTDVNPENALYRNNCSYLSPSIKEFVQERLVDLGILGHWLVLEVKMRDYDINEKEYENLADSENVQHT